MDFSVWVFPGLLVLLVLLVLSILAIFPFSNRKKTAPGVPLGKNKKDEGLDCIIVGAGVAGAALAYALGKDGRRVLVIERDCKTPDRIVGELLQPGGYLKLIELGLQDCLEDIEAQRVLGYALIKDGETAHLSYPLDGYAADIAGRSFHNGRFVQKMRNKASALDSVQLIEGTVKKLLEEDGVVKGVRYKTRVGDADQELEVRAPITFVCDGCLSNLRGELSASKIEVPSHFIGLVLENCELPCPNHGHVVLADPSPILFYPISNTEVRCLVDCPSQAGVNDRQDYLLNRIAPQLPPVLQEPFVTAVGKRVRSMPNSCMPASPIPKPGALLLGDAFNMRHPLTGGGMTVALSDIVVLRDMLRDLENFNDPEELCRYLQAFYTRRKPVASTINTLAGALYRVFCSSPEVAMKEMQRACFDYLKFGWIFSSGPVALLSGLNPKPQSLVLHFFTVALFGVARLFWRSPTKIFMNLSISFKLLMGASGIIFPIMRAEGLMQMFCPNLVEMWNTRKIY